MNTWIPDSSEYRTVWVSGIHMVSCDLADHLNTGHKQAFSVRFSDHHWNSGPFDNQTQIYHLNTRLVRYSDGYCIYLFMQINKSSNKMWQSYFVSSKKIELKFTSIINFWLLFQNISNPNSSSFSTLAVKCRERYTLSSC